MFCVHTAWSQPAQSIKLVVPYPAGGSADFLARLLGEHIGRVQGQTMVVENRAGANAVIGAEAVARSIPDGKTLLINSQDLITTPHVRPASSRFVISGIRKPSSSLTAHRPTARSLI
jgi:tripartite-type tricarboxylate transporter receptor subunit TctC